MRLTLKYTGISGGSEAYRDFTAVWEGFAADLTTTTGRYLIDGNTMHLIVYPGASVTSNATLLRGFLPSGTGLRAKNKMAFKTSQALNNSTALSDAHGQTNAASKKLDFYTTSTGSAWTASNLKRVAFETFVEIEDGLDLTSAPSRYVSNPITTTSATHKNTCPSGMVQDPNDSTKFLFYQGEFIIGDGSVGGRIRAYRGAHSNYYSLGTDLGLILEPSENYDTNGCRFGDAEVVDGEIRLYYTGIDASYKWRICLATSTDGVTFTKQGVVLDYNDTDEKSVSSSAIYKEGSTFYMLYTAWDGVTANAVNNPGASNLGIKLATSSDGITWTKTGTYVIPIGDPGAFDDLNVEDCQLYKYGSRWVAIYNTKKSGEDWKISIAYSDDITQEFTKVGLFFTGAGGAVWDGQAVSTVFINPWDLSIGYYQGWNTGVTDIPIGVCRMHIY